MRIVCVWISHNCILQLQSWSLWLFIFWWTSSLCNTVKVYSNKICPPFSSDVAFVNWCFQMPRNPTLSQFQESAQLNRQCINARAVYPPWLQITNTSTTIKPPPPSQPTTHHPHLPQTIPQITTQQNHLFLAPILDHYSSQSSKYLPNDMIWPQSLTVHAFQTHTNATPPLTPLLSSLRIKTRLNREPIKTLSQRHCLFNQPSTRNVQQSNTIFGIFVSTSAT